MDFFTIAIIMAIIYLLPELLRKRKPKEYKYPEIPENAPLNPNVTVPEESMAIEPPAHISHSVQPTVSQVNYAATGDIDRKNNWQGNLNQSNVMNGIIFAEIISPPLAKRNSKQTVYNNFKNLK